MFFSFIYSDSRIEHRNRGRDNRVRENPVGLGGDRRGGVGGAVSDAERDERVWASQHQEGNSVTLIVHVTVGW